MRAHIDHAVDELVAGGMNPTEARRRAERSFGDVDRLADECRRIHRRGRWRRRIRVLFDGLRQDLAWALRQLRRSPGFAAVAVLTLAVGIGATTTVAGVLHAVVLRPLPFDDPDRVVLVEEVTPSGDAFSVSEPTYLDWRERARSFAEVGAAALSTGTLRSAGEPRSVRVARVTASLLPVLGVTPLLGRGFSPEEDRPSEAAPVAVLGHVLWSDAFGGDPDVLGRELVVGDRAVRVVGVLPPDLAYLDRADLLLPLAADPAADREEHYLDVWARRGAAANLDEARREMRTIAAELGRIHPVDAGWSARVTPAREVLVGPGVTRAGWTLFGGALLLLVLACVNVSNLLLARATTRRREVSVRAALGAGGGRIVRQLLVESLVLAGLGGLLGLASTRLALPGVRLLGAGRIPRLEQATLDPLLLAGCVGVTLLTAALFGTIPALRLRRSHPGEALRCSRGATGPGRRLRSALVAAQVGISVVLLVGTGLLLRSFAELASVDPGFQAEHALVLPLRLPGDSYGGDERQELLRRIEARVERIPGVEHVGATAVEPFAGANLMSFAAPADRIPDDPADFTPMAWRPVTPGFAEAMGLELLRGRFLERSDGWEGDPVAVVLGRSLARRLWPDGEAVGRRVVWGDPGGSRLTVVGVVEDLRDVSLGEAPRPTMYRPYAQIPWGEMTLVVRLEPGARVAGPALRAAVREVAPALAVPEPRPLAASLRSATAEPRFHALLLGAFAAAGLLLAAVGVYGVTAFDVNRRVREIGIRLAVGGSPSQVRRVVLGGSVRTAAAGLVGGAGAAWLLTRPMERLLYGVSPGDPWSWAGARGLLAAVAALAAWLPARRASRLDPSAVLKAE